MKKSLLGLAALCALGANANAECFGLNGQILTDATLGLTNAQLGKVCISESNVKQANEVASSGIFDIVLISVKGSPLAGISMAARSSEGAAGSSYTTYANSLEALRDQSKDRAVVIRTSSQASNAVGSRVGEINIFGKQLDITKLALPAPIEDIVSQTSTYKILRMKGKYEKVTYVQLKGSSAGITAVNKDLKKISGASGDPCGMSGKAIRWVSDASNVTVEPNLYLSLNQTTDEYCGGAYPDAFVTGLVFDLSSGKRVNLDDQVTDKAELNKALLEEIAKNAEKGGCSVEDATSMGVEAYNFRIVSNTEIEVQTSFAHVARACDTSAKVSLASIKGSIKAGSLLEKVVKKAGL